MTSPTHSAALIEAYETGRALQGRDLAAWIYGCDPVVATPSWAGTDDLVISLFFEAGRRGADMPRWAKGWRYGAPPACGRSYNHRDDRYEAGISMMAIEGCDVVPDGTYELFNGRDRNRHEVEGWLVTYTTGSDGEPLLVQETP